MEQPNAIANHVPKPCDEAAAAPSNGIDLRSKIAEFANESLANSLAKCLTEVGEVNKDLGIRLSQLVQQLVDSQGAWMPPVCIAAFCCLVSCTCTSAHSIVLSISDQSID
jgi:hypothetical protein